MPNFTPPDKFDARSTKMCRSMEELVARARKCPDPHRVYSYYDQATGKTTTMTAGYVKQILGTIEPRRKKPKWKQVTEW